MRFAEAVRDQAEGHEPLAITLDGGVARWRVRLRLGDASVEELEGIFLVTLDDDGRCHGFREWWNGRRGARR